MSDVNLGTIFASVDLKLGPLTQAVKQVQDVIETVKDALDEVGDSDSLEALGEKAEKASDKIKEIGENSDEAAEKIEGIGEKAEEAAEKIEGIGEKGEKIAELGEKAEEAAEKVKGIGEKAEEAAEKIEGIGEKAERASEKIKEIGEKGEEATGKLEGTGKEAGEAADKVKNIGTNAKEGAGKVEELGKEAKTTAGKVGEVGEKAGEAKKGLDEAGKTSLGEKIKASLDKALPALTAISDQAKALAKASVTAASDFETNLNKVRNSLELSDTDFNAMKTGVSALGAESGAPLDQLATGFGNITQAGIHGADAVTVLRTSMMSALSTGDDIGETAQTVGKTLQEFGLKAADSGRAVNVLHLAAAACGQSISKFGETAEPALSAAAKAGIPLHDVTGALMALKAGGMDAGEATKQVTSLIGGIAHPSKEAREEIERLAKSSGIDLSKDFSDAGLKAKGLHGVLQDVTLATHGNEEAIGKLIDAEHGGEAATELAGKGAEDYKTQIDTLSQAMSGKLDPTTKDYGRTLDTLTGKQKRAQGGLDSIKREIGEDLEPALKSLLDEADKLIKWFNDLPPGAHKTALRLLEVGGGIATIGTTAVKVIGNLTSLGGTLTTAFGGMKTSLGLVKGAATEAEAAEAATAAEGAAAFGPAGVLMLALTGLAVELSNLVDLYHDMSDAQDQAAQGMKDVAARKKELAASGPAGALIVKRTEIGDQISTLDSQIQAQKEQQSQIDIDRKKLDPVDAENLYTEMISPENREKFGDTSKGGLAAMIQQRAQLAAQSQAIRRQLEALSKQEAAKKAEQAKKTHPPAHAPEKPAIVKTGEEGGAGEAGEADDTEATPRHRGHRRRQRATREEHGEVPEGFAKSVTSHALDQIDTPKNLASCAFFVSEVFRRAGADIGRGGIGAAKGMRDWAAEHGAHARKGSAQAGDLLVFHGKGYGKDGSGYHVGIALGNGMMIDSSGDGPGHIRKPHPIHVMRGASVTAYGFDPDGKGENAAARSGGSPHSGTENGPLSPFFIGQQGLTGLGFLPRFVEQAMQQTKAAHKQLTEVMAQMESRTEEKQPDLGKELSDEGEQIEGKYKARLALLDKLKSSISPQEYQQGKDAADKEHTAYHTEWQTRQDSYQASVADKAHYDAYQTDKQKNAPDYLKYLNDELHKETAKDPNSERAQSLRSQIQALQAPAQEVSNSIAETQYALWQRLGSDMHAYFEDERQQIDEQAKKYESEGIDPKQVQKWTDAQDDKINADEADSLQDRLRRGTITAQEYDAALTSLLAKIKDPALKKKVEDQEKDSKTDAGTKTGDEQQKGQNPFSWLANGARDSAAKAMEHMRSFKDFMKSWTTDLKDMLKTLAEAWLKSQLLGSKFGGGFDFGSLFGSKSGKTSDTTTAAAAAQAAAGAQSGGNSAVGNASSLAGLVGKSGLTRLFGAGAAHGIMAALPWVGGGMLLNQMLGNPLGKLFKHFHLFASGGTVPGVGFHDSVPAMLTPGERVIPRDQARRGEGMGLPPIVVNHYGDIHGVEGANQMGDTIGWHVYQRLPVANANF